VSANHVRRVTRARLVLVSLVASVVVAAALGSACNTSAPPSPHDDEARQPSDGDESAAPASTCEGSSNVVDRAVCPRLLADGCASAELADSATELCRRLFIDLTGAAPTRADVRATCEGNSPADIAKALMATPSYVQHAEELWAEKLAYDPAQVDGQWLDDADRLVDDLVTGRIGYDAFATSIVGHPVFGLGARLPRSDVLEDDARFYPQVGARATQLFLGRAPIAGEDVSLAKLFAFWKKKIVVLNGDYGRAQAIIDPSACPCESNALGTRTRIEIPLAEATAYADLVEAAGTAKRARSVRSPALRAQLEKAGALLVAQQPFWTQGADLALAMYLGWWKSTPNLDLSLLAEVQVALAEQLRANRSWPELVLAIVSSTLYVRTNRVAESMDGVDGSARKAGDAPPWCSGPTRILRPEAYVASLGHLLDVRVGRCDHRTFEPRGNYYPDGSEGSFFPHRLREDEDSDALALGTRDFHLAAAGAMGGCNAGAPRTEEATLSYVFGMAPTAASICAASRAIVPVGPSRNEGDGLARVADHVSMLLRGRATTFDERRALETDTASCTASAACDSEQLAVLVCTAIARSIDFATY
jgi:hypothetical protein